MTSYDKIYDVFLGHIDDVEILYPYDNETEIEYEDRISDILFSIFKSAVVKFMYPTTILTRDDETQNFTNDLRDIEIEILGMLMLREYYRKKLNFLVQLKHSFSDKDWKSHDKSNQMNQYRQLLDEVNKEINVLINHNSLRSDVGELNWLDE